MRSNDCKTFFIDASWDPNIPQFDVLNTETPKGIRGIYVYPLFFCKSQTKSRDKFYKLRMRNLCLFSFV